MPQAAPSLLSSASDSVPDFNFSNFIDLPFEVLEDSLQAFEQHPDANLQRKAFYVYFFYAARHLQDTARVKIIIKKLLSSCGNALANSYACQPCGEYLLKLPASYFDEEDRQKVRFIVCRQDYSSAYAPQPPEYLPYKDYLLLAGMLNIQEAAPRLHALCSLDTHYQHVWEAQLALARLGEPQALSFCLASIKAQLKPGLLSGNHFAELAYIRQVAVVEVFNLFLFSDEPMPDQYFIEGSDPGPTSAAFVIPYYAALLESFPIPARSGYYSDLYSAQEIALARQWVLANKDKYRLKP